MLMNLVYNEFIKYRRTALLWMIVIGGVMTAGTAYLLLVPEASKAGWNIYSATAFNCINMLSILLTAVISGYVVINEYHGNTVSNLFTYPVSRIKVFLVKFLVILIFILCLFLVFLAASILFGTLYTGELPTVRHLLKLARFCFVMTVMNFTLAPVTVLIGLVLKGTATYLFAGMGYFVINLSLNDSKYSYLIPTCAPNKIIDNYYNAAYLANSDIVSIAVISAVIFFSALISAGIYYSKSDCR